MELRPNPRHRGSHLVYPGPVPSNAESKALERVSLRERVAFNGRLLLTPAEVRSLRSLFRREAKAVTAHHRGRRAAMARREDSRAQQQEVIDAAGKRGPNPAYEARQKAMMQRILAKMKAQQAAKRATRAAAFPGPKRRGSRGRKGPALRKSPLELR